MGGRALESCRKFIIRGPRVVHSLAEEQRAHVGGADVGRFGGAGQ
jgi:hypothetical protein